MRIDAYTHFFPKKFFDKLNEVAGDYKDMGKRVRSLPALYDIDVRKKIVDGHKDYQQILSYPQPTDRKIRQDPADIDEFCRIINDGFAELCAKEKDHFPGWVGQISLAAPDAGVAEAERAVKTTRRARRADLHQRQRQTARSPGIPAVLGQDERAWHSGLAASDPRRRDPGLHHRGQIALRDLVDVRLVLRNRDRHDAPGVFQDHGHPSESENHHPSFRRHRADARRPHWPRQRRAWVRAPRTPITSRCAKA